MDASTLENPMALEPASNPSSSPSPPSRERWDRGRHFGHRHHRGHGIVPGLVLVAWGGLLLLREQGYFDPTLRAIDFWPLVIIGAGLSIAVRRRRLGSVLVGLAVTLLGAGILAQRLGYVVGVAHLWPILLIAVGIGVILNGLTRRRRLPFAANEQVSADELQRSVTMGGLALVVDSQRFRGGALSVTMGEIKADLRRAAMAGDEAALDLSVAMGGVELYVPSNWQVVNDVSPFMGVVEDKTEPRPDAAGVQRKLILRGKITMGAVTITN
jgi:predicted membrane protein